MTVTACRHRISGIHLDFNDLSGHRGAKVVVLPGIVAATALQVLGLSIHYAYVERS